MVFEEPQQAESEFSDLNMHMEDISKSFFPEEGENLAENSFCRNRDLMREFTTKKSKIL